MNHTKKIISIILAIIGAGCLIAAAVLALWSLEQDRQANELYEGLRTSADTAQNNPSETAAGEADQPEGNDPVTDLAAPQETSQPQETTDYNEPSAEEAEEPVRVTNPYAESFLANPDMAAWLQIPDTNIDYPVMWTPRDETYYLYRDFYGKDNKNGCLLLDTDSCLDPLTTNLIIHGHNMKSGAMFGNLTDYEKQSFYEDHKKISLYTKECQRNYEVIAVFRSQVYKKTDRVFKFYQFFQADTEEEFRDFYDNIKALSLYDTGVTASLGDHFLTLSTCVYHVEQGRFVVVAKEVESGDSYLPLQEQ